MTAAGWYDDPLTAGGKRYWDGTQWTDHVQAPPMSANPGPGMTADSAGPPPFTANQAVGVPQTPGPPTVYRDPNSLNDLGQWIRRSFSLVFSNLWPLTAFFLVQFAFGAVAYLLLDQGLRGSVITDDGDFFGYNSSLLIASAVLFAVAVLVAMAGTLAVHHCLYGGHVGQRPSVGESLSMGFRRLPRFIGIVLVLYLAVLAVSAILFGLVAAVSLTLGDDAGVAVVLFVLAYIAFIAASFWLSVKLAFINVGAVVIPSGTSVIKTSWDSTTGFFWPILGRQLLLGLIVGLIGMVVYVLSYIGLIALFFTQFEFTADGDLLLDGQNVETLDLFEFSSVLPNPAITIVGFGIVGFLIYIIQAVVYSGTSALYADLGGPNIFGHRRR